MQALDYFEQWLSLLEILRLLSNSDEFILLNKIDISIKIFLNDKIRMSSIYEYIHANYNDKPDVNHIASLVHLRTAAFCRYFKKQTKMTFTDFINQYHINQSKTLLLQDKNISETGYEAGFESVSHFNKLFKKINKENPTQFKKRYLQK